MKKITVRFDPEIKNRITEAAECDSAFKKFVYRTQRRLACYDGIPPRLICDGKITYRESAKWSYIFEVTLDDNVLQIDAFYKLEKMKN